MHLNVRDVVELQAERGYPMVSIFVPLSPTDGRQAAIRVKNSIRQAEDRLALELAPQEAAGIVRRLGREARTLDLSARGGAVALFASADGTRSLHLPYAVDDEVVIDDTFATRNLIHALQRLPRYLVAVLSATSVRMFEVVGDRLTEVPVDIDPATPAAVDPAWVGEFARVVDEMLDVRLAQDPQPLFLLAPERVVAGFTRRSGVRHFLVGTAAGDFTSSSPDRIRGVVLPKIATLRLEVDRTVLQRLVDARGAARLASGVHEVWDVARQGRVALLAVEEGHRYPATVGPNGQLAGEPDPTPPGVLDDAIDEIIEITLRHDGEVRFVQDGHLSEWGRVAAATRW